jgi:hypothetical protein
MEPDPLALDFNPLHTLGFLVTDWVEAHCRVPGGVYEGEPLTFNGWQLFCAANHYRVKPKAVLDPRRLAVPFHYRRSVIVGPQKCGKSPWGAGMLLAEGVGPTLFAGWAKGGEVYDCAQHGCGCGWQYVYEAGEAMGAPRRKSLLGLLAYAESQTQNVYEPLQTMIHAGPLSEFVHVREGFIRLPNRGKIVPLSSAAKSKLGQPLTGGLGDESGLYTTSNKVLDTWQTMRRGIAAMQGRTIELTNPWDPMENSAAQQAFESRAKDIFRYYRKPPADLDYKKKRDRHKIHVYAYADSPWVEVASVDAEADELIETDPTQAERFFGNRLVQGLGSFLTDELWTAQTSGRAKDEDAISLGFDGSFSGDWTALRAETRSGHPDLRPRRPADDLEPGRVGGPRSTLRGHRRGRGGVRAVPGGADVRGPAALGDPGRPVGARARRGSRGPVADQRGRPDVPGPQSLPHRPGRGDDHPRRLPDHPHPRAQRAQARQARRQVHPGQAVGAPEDRRADGRRPRPRSRQRCPLDGLDRQRRDRHLQRDVRL